jgi:NAD(P)-dependent dehydrogenase (short-subunit alcohol dehydrogenase family)
MDLRDRVVWVTGSAQRLGRAMALDLARRGAHIVVHYNRSEAEARSAVAEIEALGRRAIMVQADLSDPGQIKGVVGRIEEAFGRLDVLVASAANFHRVKLEAIDEALWDASLNVNLKGPAFCALACVELLRRGGGGKIINFADWAGFRPYRNYLPYLVSKGGVITLTKALALELAPEIQVNAIAPGPVLPPEGATAAELERMVRQVPLGRLGAPEDIVAAVAFLIEGGDYITGQVLCVDGGRLIANPA